MMGYSCAPGVSTQEVEAALRSLSLREAEDVPILAIEPGPEVGTGKVLFASRFILSLFGAADLAELAPRIFASADPGSRRLGELAASMPEGGDPRLERLRFFVAPAAQTFTFLCRKVARVSGNGRRTPIFVAAALDVRASTLRQLPRLMPPALAEAAAGPTGELIAVKAPEPTSAPPVSAAVLSLEEVRAALAPRFGPARTIRFLWRTDAEDKITEITPPLAEVVGAAAANMLGRDFGDVAKYLQLDRDGRLAQIFARRETWSGVEVLWPIAGAAAAVPVGLGGLPAYASDGRFDGFRGFGAIHLERLLAAPPRQFPAAAEPAPRAVEPAVPPPDNIVQLRPFALASKPLVETPPEVRAHAAQTRLAGEPALTSAEQKAFEEIAVALTDEERAAAEPAADSIAMDVAAESREASSARAEWLTQNGFGANALAILDRLGQGLLVSRDDVPIYVNRYLLDLLGYADEDAFHAAGGMARMFERVPSTGGEAVNIRRANGELVAVQARLQTVEWDHLPATLLTVQPDGSGEMRTGFEAALHDRDNDVHELNAILDTATDGLAIIDAQGRILALNRSGEALFGYDQSEVIGQPFTILFAAESEAKARNYFDGLRSDGVLSLLNDGREIVGRPRQGGAIPIFMTLGRIGSGRGGAPEQKFCALLRDMTHWKKVERDLQDARKEAERASDLKSDFLAKVSHEIRTPLNAILGFAEVILEERFGPIGNERYRDYLKDIHTSGAHVMSLVNDLLDLSKIEAGKMDLAFATVDANRVISECVSIMQPQANRERVIMRLALAPHLPKIMADERSLRQIILNLLSNAVKFNEPGGQVIIASAVTDAGHAVIRIRDTGIGMSEQDIETALEPFRQLATSRPTMGTGLGLPLTKALIEANRAFLNIKSKKNEGTMVEVVFPQARVVAA
jgi:PAS domain S-box-containing protein